ncbi:MAG: hypothetical protein V4665_03555 [Patescibacteria group bacterium]
MIKNKFILLLMCLGLVIALESVYQHNDREPQVFSIHPRYAADFSDDRVLVGASHNVFVGRVIEKMGATERGIGPETQFRIEVIENIKGELKGTVIVNQQGGFKDGSLYIIGATSDILTADGKNSHLLEPGATYLLATRFNKSEKWHTLNPYPTARKLIASGDADPDDLGFLIGNDPRVKELKDAYKNEILLEADLKNSMLNRCRFADREQ